MKKIQRRAEVALHAIIIAALLANSLSLIAKNMLFPALILLGLSLLAMAITLFWRPFKMVPREARFASYCLECPALLLCSFILGQQHNTDMAHLYLCLGITLPLFGFLTAKKIKKRAA